MKYKTLGTGGFAGAVVLTIALFFIYYLVGENPVIKSDYGICLPSPNLWPIPTEWSRGINLLLIIGAGVAIHFLNKAYSVIQSMDMVWSAMFLVLAATSPWASGTLNSSSLMVAINIVCLVIIFSCYKARNATQQMFMVATMLAVGSMFQYAFIFLIPAYLLMSIMMKCFGLRELTAFLMGICAPYWIAVGMGLIPIDNFHFPRLTTLFDGYSSKSDILIATISIGVTALIGILLALNNAVKLYAGNTQRRLYNNAIALLGIICLAGMILDFNNLPTYLSTFYLAISAQIANTFALWNIRRGTIWLGVISLIYVALFLIMLL